MIKLSIYAVTYDLHKPEKDYSKLTSQLKSYSSYSHRFDSFWIIDTSKDIRKINEELKETIDGNDMLLITQLQNNWAGVNLFETTVDWLNNENRSF